MVKGMCEYLPSGPRSSEHEHAVPLDVRPDEVPDHSVLVCVLGHPKALLGSAPVATGKPNAGEYNGEVRH